MNEETTPSEHHCIASDAMADAAEVNIEAVQLRLRIQHPRFSDVGLSLQSPSGTVNVVNAAFDNALFGTTDASDEWVFLANAFYGESPLGEWTLKTVDVLAGETGDIVEWELRFFVGQHPAEDVSDATPSQPHPIR